MPKSCSASHLAGTNVKKGKGKTSRLLPELPPALKHLENKLQHRFATRVSLHHADKRGRIEIEYFGSDDLHRLIGEFGISLD